MLLREKSNLQNNVYIMCFYLCTSYYKTTNFSMYQYECKVEKDMLIATVTSQEGNETH